MNKRSSVRIPVTFTRWIIFHIYLFEKIENRVKQAVDGAFKNSCYCKMISAELTRQVRLIL